MFLCLKDKSSANVSILIVNWSCGGTQAILALDRVLCCDQISNKDREDGNKCQGSYVPHHSTAGTVCCSRFHGSPGEHCCGTELYQPHREICCSGHRYSKVENVHCCGVQAYNIKDRQKKCCAGRLHILTDQSAREAQCCGSLLQKPSDVCCTSDDGEVLYSPKPGFRCCGHFYVNTSLWSCCEGRLSPLHKPQQLHNKMTEESRLVSLNNLDEDNLCGEMHAGIVNSVSLHSIVFSSVVKLHGRNATMKHLPSTYILKKPDCCNFPYLIPGKTYFFNQFFVSIDFNHDSILESFYFIISKCFPSQVSSN
ncbi:uncharacterized protein LOC141797783 [Halichoeres trimaculatus]|uniref:uncharacterized protein LOC141797783 n=1 Tax=Halichoeres trimaculatus TaxID=147232 RepID=UPI003D9DC928